MTALTRCGGVLLSEPDKDRLREVLWVGGRLNPDVIAKSAKEIADKAGLDSPVTQDTAALLVEETGWGPEYPYSGEKLSPVLTLYRAGSYADAVDIAGHILDYQGKGHSLSIHTSNPDRPLALGLEMPVCRIIVNQVHSFAAGGAFDNGLPFSLSMGCGTWGGNSISENLTYRHFLNITRICRTIPSNQPDEEELFGAYWDRHNCRP